MSQRIVIAFGGLNTDLNPNRLPEGEADRMVNTVLDAGDLRRRRGFEEWEDDADGSATAIKNIFATQFADGEVYVEVKIGTKLYQRKVYPTDAESFSAITGGHTHTNGDRGWGFVWDNFFHYGDRSGLSKWCPDRHSGVAYKAGLPRPSTGPVGEGGDEGEKDGLYHYAWAVENSRTEEEGVISTQQTPPLECRNASDTGGIAVTNWSTLRALHTDYEWDRAWFYCSFGSTEFDPNGADNADSEKYSYRLYRDALVLKSQVANVGLNKADSVLRAQELFTNAGGEPPGSLIGCFDGLQAIYAGTYGKQTASLTTELTGTNNDLTYTARRAGAGGNAITVQYTGTGTAGSETVTVTVTAIVVDLEAGVSTAAQVEAAVEADMEASDLVTVADATDNDGTGTVPVMAATNLSGGTQGSGSSVPGRVDFSLPGYPTSVPAREKYIIGGDSYTPEPRPWAGQIRTGLVGKIIGAAAGGGRILLFTPTSVTELVGGPRQKLTPVLRSSSHGCAGEAACAGTPDGVYFMGYSHLTRVGRGMTDLAKFRIRSMLEAIPVDARDDSVVAYYSHARQAWAAIAREGGTKPQRILIYDEDLDRFMCFDLACLGTRAALSTACTGDDNDLTYTAEAPGAEGNSVQVEYADGGTAGEEQVTVSGTKITVTLDAGTSTAAQVLAAVNNSGDATRLATAALKSGNDGTGTVPIMTATNLSGGTGDEAITAMCEMALPNADPVMLLATDAGRILKYPSGDDDGGVHYAAHWRAYTGQKSLVRRQYLSRVEVCPIENVADNVRIGVRAMRMGQESDRRQYSAILHKDGLLTPKAEQMGTRHGRIFQIEIFTPHTVTDRWTVSDLHAVVDTT